MFKCKPEKVKLFKDIDGNEIQAGKLGNCHVLPIVSVLSEFPDLVCSMFNNKKSNLFGAYSVNLFNKGQLEEFLIDDSIPCIDREPMFCESIDDELWINLVEKAMAKWAGSYADIDIPGNEAEMMEVCLGSPSARFYNNEGGNKIFNSTKSLSEFLVECDNMNYLILATPKQQQYAHVVISVYNAVHEEDTNSDICLIQMRNPYDDTVFSGVYNETSAKWTKELKELTDFEEGMKEDGLFFITAEEFLSIYGILTVNQHRNEHASITCKSAMDIKHTQYFALALE